MKMAVASWTMPIHHIRKRLLLLETQKAGKEAIHITVLKR